MIPTVIFVPLLYSRPFSGILLALQSFTAGSELEITWTVALGPSCLALSEEGPLELTREVLPTSALFYLSCVSGQDKRIPGLGNAQAAAAAS